MAVARDAVGAGATTTGAACTASHTIGVSAADTVVLAFVAISVSSNDTNTTCSATYGGVAMTQLGLTTLGSTTSRSAYAIYYLFNPASGAQNCVVTPGGTSTKAGVAVATLSYTGVASVGTWQTAASLSLATTTVADGFNVFGHINGVTMTSPSQTQRKLLGAAVSGVGDFLLVQDTGGIGQNLTFSCSGTATTPSTFGTSLSPTPVSRPEGFVYETFTDADGTEQEDHTGETSTWNRRSGSTSPTNLIGSNRLRELGVTYCAGTPPPSADYQVDAQCYILTALSGATVIVAGRNSQTASTTYCSILVNNSGTYAIVNRKYVAGTPTDLNSTNIATPSVGSTVKVSLRMVGNQITTLYQDNVINTTTDSSISAAGGVAIGGTAMGATTGIWVDEIRAYEYPRVYTATDAVGVTDSFLIEVGRDATDPVGITDSKTFDLTGGGTDYPVSATDPVGVTDSSAITQDWARTQTDPVGITDSFTKDAGRSATDPVGIADSVTKDAGRTATDPVGVTDSLTKDAGRTATDPVGVTDAVSIQQDWARSQTDPVGITDALAKDAGRSGTDPVGVTDSTTVQQDWVRTQTDPVGVTDSLAKDAGRSATDPLGITDAGAVTQDWVRTNTDPVGVDDGATFVIQSAGNISATDLVGIADLAAVRADYQRSWVDPVGVADSASFVIVSAGVIASNDPIGITDSLGLAADYARSWTDPVGVADDAQFQLVGAGGGEIATTDPVGLSDAARFAFLLPPGPLNTWVVKPESAIHTVGGESASHTGQREYTRYTMLTESNTCAAKAETNHLEVIG